MKELFKTLSTNMQDKVSSPYLQEEYILFNNYSSSLVCVEMFVTHAVISRKKSVDELLVSRAKKGVY